MSVSSSSSSSIICCNNNVAQLRYGTFKLFDRDASELIKYLCNRPISNINMSNKKKLILIDTANIYKNEVAIGIGINEAKIDRELIHIQSKLNPRYMKSIDSAYSSIINSNKLLNCKYIDSYLIHWPGSYGVKSDSEKNKLYREYSYRALVLAKENGIINEIGISNYQVQHIKELINSNYCKIKPIYHQLEIHPLNYLIQVPIINCTREYNIKIQSYGVLGSSNGNKFLLQNPTILQLAEKYNCSSAQLLIVWSIQHNFEPVVKSGNIERIEENYSALDCNIVLDDDEMIRLDNLSQQFGSNKFCWDSYMVK